MSSIQKCNDGTYRWVYELNLYKNPTVLILICKVFFFVFLGIWAFATILGIIEDGFSGESLWNTSKVFLIIMGGFMVLAIVSYFIYALIMGGKYCVMFEMNEQGIKHTQIPRQMKKAQVIGFITMLTGAATGNPATTGVGMLSLLNTSMYSRFSSVTSVKPYPKRNLIKVNEALNKNQVYVEREDYDFVLGFIKYYTGK